MSRRNKLETFEQKIWFVIVFALLMFVQTLYAYQSIPENLVIFVIGSAVSSTVLFAIIVLL